MPSQSGAIIWTLRNALQHTSSNKTTLCFQPWGNGFRERTLSIFKHDSALKHKAFSHFPAAIFTRGLYENATFWPDKNAAMDWTMFLSNPRSSRVHSMTLPHLNIPGFQVSSLAQDQELLHGSVRATKSWYCQTANRNLPPGVTLLALQQLVGHVATPAWEHMPLKAALKVVIKIYWHGCTPWKNRLVMAGNVLRCSPCPGLIQKHSLIVCSFKKVVLNETYWRRMICFDGAWICPNFILKFKFQLRFIGLHSFHFNFGRFPMEVISFQDKLLI